MKNLLLLSLAAIFFISSCRKKEDPVVTNETGKVSFTFENMAGNAPLVLSDPSDASKDKWYIIESGDSLKITQYKYYATNFVLHSDSGNYKQPESYYLIDESNPQSKQFTINDVPKRKYTKISFLIGVDEERNTSGAQTGALDVNHGMFWDWNTGYIMARLEGVSPQSPVPSQTVSLHIAGFQGENSVLRLVTLDLPQPVDLTDGGLKNIHIKADVLEWFKTPNEIKISEIFVVASVGQDAVKIANNYSDMFKIDHID